MTSKLSNDLNYLPYCRTFEKERVKYKGDCKPRAMLQRNCAIPNDIPNMGGNEVDVEVRSTPAMVAS